MCTFLLDTQAEISIIKSHVVSEDVPYDINTLINIKGITNDTIESMGLINADLFLDDFLVSHDFHVVPESFLIPADGIIGKDFFKTYKCIIDYDNRSLTVRLPTPVTIPMFEGPEEDIMSIPPRSECFRIININNFSEPLLFEATELTPGVFSARTIAYTAKPLVRIMNTTQFSVNIRKNSFRTSKLSDYHIFSVNKTEHSSERLSQLEQIINPNVPSEAKSDLFKLINEFQDIFSLPSDKMTVNNFYQQKLRISDDSPVYIKNYRTPFAQRDEINSQVNKLLDSDLIEPSCSQYNSPVLLVPKKPINGKQQWRMCVDYRAINKKIIADKFPLARIEDILDLLGRAKYFTVLDLFSGFHQVPLEADSRDITSFSTHDASYRWKVLPFGLKVSPNSFSRMMSLAFAGATALQHFLYMDDIIVIGCSVEHHIKNLNAIFNVCRKYNLKLNPNKCNFFKHEVTYLGHICSDRGIFPDPNKLKAVKNYPIPDSKDAVKRFVAFANFYRKFIPNFSGIAKALNELTRKKAIFVWQDAQQRAFNKLKNALTTNPILVYPDFSKQFVLYVDASKDAVGAALCQKHENTYMPISYASKCFNKAELNKSTIEKELLAIHFAIKHYRPYLFNVHFEIKSDHKPLTYLFALKDPSSKLTRIRLDLEEYDFTIVHVKGRDNVIADALSRINISDLKSMRDINKTICHVTTRSMARNANLQANNPIAPTITDTGIQQPKAFEPINNEICQRWPLLHFKCTQNNNKFAISAHITKNKQTLTRFNTSVTAIQIYESVFARLNEIADRIDVNKCKIYNNDEIFQYVSIEQFKLQANKQLKRLCIAIIRAPIIIHDENEKINIMKQCHDHAIFGGHCGKRRLHAKIRSNYYWKSMSRDISSFVNRCNKCQINKPKNKTHVPMCLTDTPQRPFECVVIDTVGPLRRTTNNNKYIVTIICNLTKYLIAVPVANKEARTVAQAIANHLFLVYGPFTKMITDQGTEYNNSLFTSLCSILQINHGMSTAYHHETVGSIERNHRVLNEYLRHYLDTDEWDNLLRYYTYCYNCTPHTSFSFAYSPFELIFGKQVNELNITKQNHIDPLYNVDDYSKEFKYNLQLAHKHAKSMLENAKQVSKMQYDRKNKFIDFNIGDQILITNEGAHKHDKLYLGPFEIIDVSEFNVTVNDNSKPKTVHKNRIIKYKT